MSGKLFDFGNFFSGLNSVKNPDDFIRFFEHQPLEVQVIMGIVMFGLLVLLWIFITAIFIDKHI